MLEFSSELKCLNHRFTLNQDAIDIYLSIGYILSPPTLYSDCSQLQPGEILSFTLSDDDTILFSHTFVEPNLIIGKYLQENYIDYI